MANISLSIDGLTTGNPEAVSDLMNVVNDPTKFDNVKPVEETDFDFEQTVNDTFDEIEGEEVQESDDELEDVVDPRKNRANPDEDEDEDEEILLEDDPSKEENNLEADLDKMEKEAQVAMGEVDRMFNESVNQLPEPDGIYDSSLILKAYEMDKRPHDEWSDKFAIYTITPDYKDIADMKYIDKKDVYTYQPKENEYALDMSRDSGNIVYDYDFVPMGKIVDRWNRWREPINESYNIIESLKKDYESGKLSIDEIAEELYKAGHFNYIPDKDEVCEKLGIEELKEGCGKKKKKKALKESVEVVSNENGIPLKWTVDTDELSDEDKEFLKHFIPNTYYSDVDAYEYAMDEKLPSGRWLENIKPSFVYGENDKILKADFSGFVLPKLNESKDNRSSYDLSTVVDFMDDLLIGWSCTNNIYDDYSGETLLVYEPESTLKLKKEQFEEFKKEIKNKFGNDVRISFGLPKGNSDKTKLFLYFLCNDDLNEDTAKRGSSWVNKGKEGTHGKFKTKKAADKQRKAMFANGYKAESVNESTRIKQQKELLNEAKLVDDDFDDEVRVFFVKEPNPYTEKDEVLAVFPDIIETSDGFVRCYAHLGQHSNCDLDYVRKLEPATEEEYESLLRELKTNAKYDNLVVISPNDVLLKESADFDNEDDTDSFEYLYSLLVNGNISLYKARLMRMSRDEIRAYQDWAREMGINQKLLKLQYANANEKDVDMRSFANEDDEDDTDTFEYVWSSLVNGNMTQYHNQLKRMSKYELRQYIDWAEEQGIPYEDLQLEFMYETLNPDLQYHSREGHMVKNGTTKPCHPQRTVKTINSNGKEVTGFTPKQDEIMRDKVVTIVENFEKVIKQSDEKLYPALQRRLTDKLLNEGVTTKVITKIIENLF